MQDMLSETLSEFRSTSVELRETLEAMREEMAELSRLQQRMLLGRSSSSGTDDDSPARRRRERKRLQKRYDALAKEVEGWAAHLLFEIGEGEEDGWKDVECSKLLRNKYNKDGTMKVYLKVSGLVGQWQHLLLNMP